jgi:hypothetical protein
VVYVMENPVTSNRVTPGFCAFATLTGEGGESGEGTDRLTDSLAAAFADGVGEHRMIGSLPTYEHLFSGSPVTRGLGRTLFRAAFDAAREEVDWDADSLAKECADLLAFRGDPWGWAKNNLEAGPEPERAFRAAVGLAAGDESPADAPERGADGDESRAIEAMRLAVARAAEDAGVTFDELADVNGLFALWFAIVSDPEHVASMEAEMERAWVDAQEFHLRYGSLPPPPGRSSVLRWTGPTGSR